MAKKKDEGLEKASKGIESLYKNGGIVNLEENPRFTKKVRTNRPSLDFVTDGGVPIGRLILISGQESAGKSSLAKR